MRQVTAPVRWVESVVRWPPGVTRMLEVGPGKVLTGLARAQITGRSTRWRWTRRVSWRRRWGSRADRG